MIEAAIDGMMWRNGFPIDFTKLNLSPHSNETI